MIQHLRTMRTALPLVAALLAGPARAVDLTPLEAQRRLAGTWAGDGTTLVIDTERLQGNVDPDRPFDWHAFRIVNVSGRMVVFDIGERRFLALLDMPQTLRVTSTSFGGERALHHVPR